MNHRSVFLATTILIEHLKSDLKSSTSGLIARHLEEKSRDCKQTKNCLQKQTFHISVDSMVSHYSPMFQTEQKCLSMWLEFCIFEKYNCRFCVLDWKAVICSKFCEFLWSAMVEFPLILQIWSASANCFRSWVSLPSIDYSA